MCQCGAISKALRPDPNMPMWCNQARHCAQPNIIQAIVEYDCMPMRRNQAGHCAQHQIIQAIVEYMCMLMRCN